MTQYYYQNLVTNGTGNNLTTSIVTALIQSILGSPATGLAKGNITNISNQFNIDPNFLGKTAPDGNNANGTNPKAYMTIVFFDERFNYVAENSTALRVSQQGDNAAPLVLANIKAPKNGFAYIYLSNESNEPVYFDNFTVADNRGRIIEEDHYYAFGLKIAGISSKKLGDPNEGTLQNNYAYQGDFSEMDEDIGWNDFTLRNYDGQIGRWVQMDPFNEFPSPYTGMGNEPILNIDPSGGWASTGLFEGLNGFGKAAVTTLGGAIVGGAIDVLSGGDGGKGLLIGASLGLASNGSIGSFASSNLKVGGELLSKTVRNTQIQTANPYGKWAGTTQTKERPDLGKVGNLIRGFAGSDFSKDLFENYWQGKGVYYLSYKNFKATSDFIKQSNLKARKGIPIDLGGEQFEARVENFYGSEIFDKAFGSATIIYDLNGKPVGFFDIYDFDPHKWGDRSIASETKTRLVYLASIFGRNARPFAILYGKGIDYFWKYIVP
jgi:RHS repeat-associated protein